MRRTSSANKVPVRSDADRQAIAQHVAYEKWMLDHCLTRLWDPVAYTAAFLHQRNLLDFFYGPKGRGHADQVLADHFFDDPISEWKKHREALPPLIARFRDALDKLAAHLSYDRLAFARTGYGAMRTDCIAHINTTWDKFLAALPPERVAWFRLPPA